MRIPVTLANADLLPEPAVCSQCKAALPADIAFDVVSETWRVWCECGNTSNASPSLIQALKSWNTPVQIWPKEPNYVG